MDKSKKVENRTIRIKLVDGTLINGQVNIARDPGHDRLSDLLANHKEPVVILYNATLYETGLDNPVKHKTIFINKVQIMYATPDDDQK